MATHDIVKIWIDPFWDGEYKSLKYSYEPFNDEQSLHKWRNQGYGGTFTGVMCDMRRPQPSWNFHFIKFFEMLGWLDIGTSYYRMDTGTILPTHQDLYTRYIKLFNLLLKNSIYLIYLFSIFIMFLFICIQLIKTINLI